MDVKDTLITPRTFFGIGDLPVDEGILPVNHQNKFVMNHDSAGGRSMGPILEGSNNTTVW